MSTECICIRECDCQAPNGLDVEEEQICAPLKVLGLGKVTALMSNYCPDHNDVPMPDPECPADVHWFEE